MFGPETFVERVGDDALAQLAAAGGFAYVDHDEPAVHGRIVAVRTHGPGSATRMRLMAVESARSVPRAANPGFPDIAVTRASETTIRAVVVFGGRSEAQRPVTTAAAHGSGRNRLPRHVARWGNPVVTGR